MPQITSSDIKMPVMSGMDFLRAAQQKPEHGDHDVSLRKYR
jgi:CheY-like chemotaxis protein